MARKKYPLAEQSLGKLVFSFGAADGRRAASRSAIFRGPLRNMHRVPGCVPHVGVRSTPSTRCESLHQLLDHRASLVDPNRAAIADGRLGLRLRRVPRRMSLESQTRTDNRPWLRAAEELDPLNLDELFFLTDEQFRARFRQTPLWRPRRRGLLRNAAIALGNQKSRSSIPALSRGLKDPEPLVHGACIWALGCMANDAIRALLCDRLAHESDTEVRTEVEAALLKSAAKQDPQAS